MMTKKLLGIFLLAVSFNSYTQESPICDCHIDYLLISAEQGDADAQNKLNALYPKLITLAAQGNAEAQYMLGAMYSTGQVVIKNPMKSYIWLSLAKDRTNDNNKEIYLSFLLDRFKSKFNKELTKTDIEKAKSIIQQCLDSNYQSCDINNLVPTNSSQETNIAELTTLAEQGNANAQYDLGRIYAEGQGVLQSYEKAFNWYQQSAKQGHKEAQLNLGLMYGSGAGTNQDLVKGYMWLKLSEESLNVSELLVGQMSATDIEKAKTLAQQCLDSNYQDCY